jgi:6-phosphogluconolactonase/glucosamine-6-phosphate isomerase/deaminase
MIQRVTIDEVEERKSYNAVMSSLHLDSSSTPLAAAVSAFQAQVSEYLDQSIPLLLFLSGGSNIALAEQALLPLQEADPDRFSRLAKLLPLDERFSTEPQLNNSLQLLQTGIRILPLLPLENEPLELFAQRFGQEIETWILAHPNGKILATLGMGPDGHIAGISPLPIDPQRFDSLFVSNPNLAVGYLGNLEPAERITVTIEGLKHVNAFYGVVSGRTKRDAFEAFRAHSSTPDQHPVQLLHQLDVPIFLFSDLALAR